MSSSPEISPTKRAFGPMTVAADGGTTVLSGGAGGPLTVRAGLAIAIAGEAAINQQLLRHVLEEDLRGALEAGEFHLAYQPQLRLDTGELTGFEALLRWNSAKRGSVSPAEFIPIAEETGMIVPLGEWVLRTACAAAAKWPDQIKIAVNLSPMQFRARGLAAMVTSALATTAIAWPPALRSASAFASPDSRLRPSTATRAPAATSASARLPPSTP